MSMRQASISKRRFRATHLAAHIEPHSTVHFTTRVNACGQCVVTQAVLIRLRSSPYYTLRSLTCEFRSGYLFIDGTLPSFFMKQMAQESVRTVDRVNVIVNRVIVLASD